MSMTNSKKLAGLIGPTILALTVSEAMNLHIWSVNIAPVTYLNGTLLFIAGLSIVSAHNLWRGWPMLVTLAGWIGMLGGLYRLFVPEAPQASQHTATYVGIGILFGIGVFLTFKAYGKTEDDTDTDTPKIRYGVFLCLLVLSVFQGLLLSVRLQVPRTVEFTSLLPFTEINGYKYHTEIVGSTDSIPLIVVHGGPGLDYEYLKPLKALSNHYRVIFYDQRGTGLSPRVDKKMLTIEQSLSDLHSVVQYFSNGKKVNIIGHSWGATLVVGYLSKHSEMVSQAVIVEPVFLYPGMPVKEWTERFKNATNMGSVWEIASNMIYYPFVRKEDGQEGYDYIGIKITGRNEPGPPYNCEGQALPPNTLKRMGYAAYNAIMKPVMDNPNFLKYDFTHGIAAYHGDLLLMSGECSILGPAYQKKYNVPRLPSQTVHVKAENMGHHMITLNADWTLQTIRRFLNGNSG